MLLTYVLTHYFLPRHSNNQKAKVLHSSTLLFLVFSLVFYQVILQVLPLTGLRILGYAANISTTEVINYTNAKRTEAGLGSLEFNSFLAQAAKAKGEDMLAQDYWAHVAPDGTQPWKFFVDAGYKYRYAGENLARDFADPSSAVEAWMSSPSHKENMLSPKYQEIGVAVVEGDLAGVETTLIVQFFGTGYVDTTPQVPLAKAETKAVSEPTPTPAPLSTEVGEEGVAEVAASVPVTASSKKPTITFSPFDTTRGVSLLIIGSLLVVMVVDGIVTAKRKVTRIGGRTFAHLAFLGMILAIVVIARAGKIL